MNTHTPGRAVSLYRSLLRAHKRYLPPAMRDLGDTYVKAEFRQHKSATDPTHVAAFLAEWDGYLDNILATAHAQNMVTKEHSVFQFGENLPSDVDLSDEQKEQLAKLKKEASRVGK